MVEEYEEYAPSQYASSVETQEQTEDFQKFRLNTSDLLEDLNHRLNGEIYLPETEKWEKQGEPLVNDDGRKSIITHLNMLINKNVILSRHDPEIVQLICLETNTLLRELLIKHQADWGIKSLTDVKMLKHDLIVIIESSIRRAQKGFESKSIGKVMRTSESQVISNARRRGLPMLPGSRRER